MDGFEGERIFYTDQNLINNEVGPNNNDKLNQHDAENKFMHFIRQTQEDNIFVYREQLRNNAQRGNYFLKFDMAKLQAFDDQLATEFKERPAELIKTFESATQIVYNTEIFEPDNVDMEECPKFQVQVNSDENPTQLRGL